MRRILATQVPQETLDDLVTNEESNLVDEWIEGEANHYAEAYPSIEGQTMEEARADYSFLLGEAYASGDPIVVDGFRAWLAAY